MDNEPRWTARHQARGLSSSRGASPESSRSAASRTSRSEAVACADDDKPRRSRRNSDAEVADMLVAAAAASPELAAMSPGATPVPGPSRARSRSRPASPEQPRVAWAVCEGSAASKKGRKSRPKSEDAYSDADSGIEDGAIDGADEDEYRPRLGIKLHLKRAGKRRAEEESEESKHKRRASAPQLPPPSILRLDRRASAPGFHSVPSTPATPGFELPDGIASARWSSARSRMVVIIPPRSERQQPKIRRHPPIYYSYTRSPPRSRKLSFGAPAPSPASVFASDRQAKLKPGEPVFAQTSPRPPQGENVVPRASHHVGLLPPIASDDGRRALGSPPATLDSVLDFAASPEAMETPPSDREHSTPGTSLSSTPTGTETFKVGQLDVEEAVGDDEMAVDVELDEYIELGSDAGKLVETTIEVTVTQKELQRIDDTDAMDADDHPSPVDDQPAIPPIELWS